MFATNERLLGSKITYDGNPHTFEEKGFMVQEGGKRVDPRAFRVFGGNFMNSAAGSGVGGYGSGELLGGFVGWCIGRSIAGATTGGIDIAKKIC